MGDDPEEALIDQILELARRNTSVNESLTSKVYGDEPTTVEYHGDASDVDLRFIKRVSFSETPFEEEDANAANADPDSAPNFPVSPIQSRHQ